MDGALLRVAAVQLEPHPRSLRKTIERAQELTERALRSRAQLVCLPEHWLPETKIPASVNLEDEFRDLAGDYGAWLVLGGVYLKRKGSVRLTSPVMGPDGKIRAYQDKVHLFRGEKKVAKPGNGFAPLSFDGHRLGVLVCYDAVFPEAARVLALAGAEILAIPSRIVKQGIDPWHQYLKIRSLENRIPVVAANVWAPPMFPGGSMVLGFETEPKTKVVYPAVLAKAKQGPRVIVASVDVDGARTIRRERMRDRRPIAYRRFLDF